MKYSKGEMTPSEYIKNKLIELGLDTSAVILSYKDFLIKTGSKSSFESYKRRVRENYEELVLMENDGNMGITINALAKSKQALLDKNRLQAKVSREQFRGENVVDTFSKEILTILEDYDLSRFMIKKHLDLTNYKKFGVLQLNDLHLNEIVNLEDADSSYDFTIASKRLKKFILKALDYFKAFKVDAVFIAGLGDFINSDRRLDEKMSMATGRISASMLAVYLLEQAIVEVGIKFPTSVAFVSGNESRVNQEYGHSDFLSKDNYDWIIYKVLQMALKKTNINFLEESKNFSEKVVNLNGFHLLLTHGNPVASAKDTDRFVRDVFSRYAQKGVILDYILAGHIHQTCIADYIGRGASLVGGNAYSNRGLNLEGKASQNIYIVEGKNIDRIAIDLQDVTGYEGYDLKDKLVEYSAKSVPIILPTVKVIVETLI